MNWLRITVFAGLCLLYGCGMFKNDLEKCHENSEYQDARPAPRVRVPDDLDPLPLEARLEVPFGEANTEATPPDQPCLIEPPSYSDRSTN